MVVVGSHMWLPGMNTWPTRRRLLAERLRDEAILLQQQDFAALDCDCATPRAVDQPK